MTKGTKLAILLIGGVAGYVAYTKFAAKKKPASPPTSLSIHPGYVTGPSSFGPPPPPVLSYVTPQNPAGLPPPKVTISGLGSLG